MLEKPQVIAAPSTGKEMTGGLEYIYKGVKQE